jgi:saccharopine dehydrogenase (NAD+, L-lysine forming)
MLGAMELLVIGAGGVGSAAAVVALRRPFVDRVVLADVDPGRAAAAAAASGDPGRARAEVVDASSRADVLALVARTRPDAVLNACDPRFN